MKTLWFINGFGRDGQWVRDLWIAHGGHLVESATFEDAMAIRAAMDAESPRFDAVLVTQGLPLATMENLPREPWSYDAKSGGLILAPLLTGYGGGGGVGLVTYSRDLDSWARNVGVRLLSNGAGDEKHKSVRDWLSAIIDRQEG